MNKPNTMESVQPCSKQYSFKTDLKLNAWMAVAGLFWVLSLYLIREHPDMKSSLRVAVALSPLAPGLLYVRSGMRFVRGLDELQRRIQLEALLFAALGTLAAGTAINVLNANGVSFGRFPHGLELGAAFILMFLLWLVGTVIATRRYK